MTFTLWRKLLAKWPLVWRSRLDANIRAHELSQRDWNSEIVRERGRADQAYELAARHIRRISRLVWERKGPYYAVRVEFDTRAVTGYHADRELRFLAECIGREVEREIATSRFVQQANSTSLS